MNDIHEASQNFKVILYADDTNLTSPYSYFSPPLSTKESDIEVISSNINWELNDIQEWLSINKLTLNVKKTKYMLFHYRQRNISNIIPNMEYGKWSNILLQIVPLMATREQSDISLSQVSWIQKTRKRMFWLCAMFSKSISSTYLACRLWA